MRQRPLIAGLLLLAAAGCASNRHAAQRGAEAGEQDEVKVAFADVPANVRTVLTREAKGAAIASVDREMLDGKHVYEADVAVDGTNREIVVAADGTLIHNKVDAEEERKVEDDEKNETTTKS